MKKLGVLAIMMWASAIAFAQPSDTCENVQQARRPVVTAFRILNTAEMQLKRAKGRYANISELLQSPEAKKASEMVASGGNDASPLGTPDDPLPGYNLRLIVAADGKTYAMTATREHGPCRLLGATTDERGIIYLIEPMK